MLQSNFNKFAPNPSTNESILFITAYKDINRSSWQHYKMTNNDYVTSFLNILNYMTYDTIVFVEQHIFDLIMTHSNNTVKSNIQFVNIDNFIQNCSLNSFPISLLDAHTSLQKKTCKGADFLGWIDLPEEMSDERIVEIQNYAKTIRENSDILIICGI